VTHYRKGDVTLVYIVRSERGLAAVLALIAMMLLGIMGIGLMGLSKIDIEIAANHRDGVAAQYVAEGGIQWAIVQLKTDPDFVIETKIQKNVTTYVIDKNGSTFASCTVTTTLKSTTNDENLRVVTSIGSVNKAKRQISTQIRLPAGKEDPLEVIWDD